MFTCQGSFPQASVSTLRSRGMRTHSLPAGARLLGHRAVFWGLCYHPFRSWSWVWGHDQKKLTPFQCDCKVVQ